MGRTAGALVLGGVGGVGTRSREGGGEEEGQGGLRGTQQGRERQQRQRQQQQQQRRHWQWERGRGPGGREDGEDTPADGLRMYQFKVKKCMRSRSHDWTECPYAHPGRGAAAGPAALCVHGRGVP